MLNPIISYQKPSQATIYYPQLDQFTIVETRSGGVVDLGTWLIVLEVVTDAWKRERALEGQYLKVRRVFHDDVHSNVTISVQLLHSSRDEPELDALQIAELFGHGIAGDHGQVVHVEAVTTAFNTGSDRFNAISDEYY